MKNRLIRTIIVDLLIPVLLSSGVTTAAADEAMDDSMEQTVEILEEWTEMEIEPETEPEQDPEESLQAVVTEHKSEDSEQFLWDCISRYSPTDEITAGILARFWRESFYRSDCTAHWSEVLAYTLYDQPEDFTAEIDSGLADGSTKELFVEEVHDVIGGYGLGQWYSVRLLEELYDFAREWGTSIADAEMQCAFTVKSMEEMDELWEELLETRDPRQAGERIALGYDGTTKGYVYIGQMAELFYDEYAKDKTK